MRVSKEAWNLKDESFGPLLEYVRDEEITDINYNGKDVWVEHLKHGIYKVPVHLTEEFVSQLSIRVSNVVSEQINKFNNVLEADTDIHYTSKCHQYRVCGIDPQDTGGHAADKREDAEGTVLFRRGSGVSGPLHEGQNEYGFLRTPGCGKDGTAEVPDTVYTERRKGDDHRG